MLEPHGYLQKEIEKKPHQEQKSKNVQRQLTSFWGSNTSAAATSVSFLLKSSFNTSVGGLTALMALSACLANNSSGTI